MSQSDNLTEAELRRRLAEAEAALAALRSGKADTLIGDAGPLLFQRKSAVEAQKQAEAALRESEARLRALLDSVEGIVWEADPTNFQFTYVSPKAEQLLGYPLSRWLEEPAFWADHIHPEDRDRAVSFCTEETRAGRNHEFEYRMLAADGRIVWLRDLVTVVAEQERPARLRGIMVDITARKQAEALLVCQTKVLELIATGAPLATTLSTLVQQLEAHEPGLLGSVLLLDEDGVHLRHGAAPSLPEAYNRAIDGLAIGPNVGSCGTAAFRGEAVVVEDIATDPLWKDYRELALAHGLRACWSTPIFDEQRRVLGTFAIYYRQPGRPAPEHLRCVEMATHLAAVAIQKLREEAALRESERRLATLMANLPGMAYRCANRPHWPMEFVSEGCAGLTGWPASALLQNRPAFGELIVEADRQFVWDTVQRALAARRPYELTFRIQTADGQLRWVWERGCGVFAPDGSLLFLEGFITDITERKQAEDRARRLAAFPELNADPVLEFAADGSLTYHNPAAQELVRRFGARDLQELMPPNSDQIIRDCLASGRPRLRVETRWGDRTLSWSFYPIEQLGVVHAYAGDITERKQVEEALRESEARFRRLFENSLVGIYRATPDGRILLANPTLVKMLRYPSFEALAQLNLEKDGFHPQSPRRLFKETMERDGVVRGLESVWICADGTAIYVRESAQAVRGPDGRIEYYDGVVEDITEQRRLEESLRQAQKMEAIGRLAGGVAHDFNNILAVIMMQSELLLTQGDVAESVRNGIQQIRAAAERAANLTRQLLAFSRRQVMQARDLDLNEVVTNLTKMLQRIIGEDVRLELHLHPTPLMTHADAGMLDQVLMNLAVNARDAMPKGGRLIIETTAREFSAAEAAALLDVKPGHYVGLRVSDTGCGIPPEILPRIFEPFFTTKEPGKGTGLGLATVFGIVKQHGGCIQVASEPGRGTTFEVYLPALAETTTAASEAESRPGPRGGTETILLVEDDADVRLVTRLTLERHGYRVLEAPDGLAALELWRQHRDAVALLLTDLVMPGELDGRELAQRLRADRPQLKVIYTSGYSPELAGRELHSRAGEAFLQKPCPAERLLETVRECLDAPLGATRA